MRVQVASALEHLVREGRVAWPSLAVDDSEFAAFVSARLAPDELASAHAADLFLAFGCVKMDHKALDAFERTYVSRIPDYVHRVDNSKAFASEVQQILREKLLVGASGTAARIGEYAGRGPLGSWVRVVAVRVALELRRARKPEVSPDDDGAAGLAADDDPELGYLRVRYATEFREAFTESLSSLDARQQTILQLYLGDGLNIDRIGQMYQVHRATVARWIAGTRDQLYDETRRRLRDKLQIEPAEFESIVRLVRSQLDISVQRILREASSGKPEE